MSTTRSFRLGLMFSRELPPEDLVSFARMAEAAGADDLWLVEDLGWSGAMSSAATALAATTRLRVGVGLTPAPLRSPALLAMEIAVLARLYPARFVAGVGHGVQTWMRQVGVAVNSPMALLEESVTAVQGLLSGQRISIHGRQVSIDDFALVHPPETVPPVFVGGIGARTLRLSGRLGDGSLLVEGMDPRRLTEACAIVNEGRELAAGKTDAGPVAHEIATLVYAYVSDDPDQVTEARRLVAAEAGAFLGIPPEEVFIASGPAAVVADSLKQLQVAGADTAILHLIGENQARQGEVILREFQN